MTIKPFDTVILNQDIPEMKLKAGMKGAVLDVYTTPQLAYEVEFPDENSIVTLALLPQQITKLNKQ
jgi:hypothetical protein